jgi:hypothetical protein
MVNIHPSPFRLWNVHERVITAGAKISAAQCAVVPELDSILSSCKPKPQTPAIRPTLAAHVLEQSTNFIEAPRSRRKALARNSRVLAD